MTFSFPDGHRELRPAGEGRFHFGKDRKHDGKEEQAKADRRDISLRGLRETDDPEVIQPCRLPRLLQEAPQSGL